MSVLKRYPYKCFYCEKEINAYYPPEWGYEKIACEECYKQNIAWKSLEKAFQICYNVNMNKHIISTRKAKRADVKNAIVSSSRIEGMNFARAKKNNFIIKKLQKYGRAFSV